jgi:flagellar biosynthesis/type III secretory pathway protein FliH
LKTVEAFAFADDDPRLAGIRAGRKRVNVTKKLVKVAPPEVIEPQYENYLDALSAGHEGGLKMGREEGFDAGHSEGHETGFTAGRAEGFSDGYRAGLLVGFEAGIDL